jgi:hypothetical protein
MDAIRLGRPMYFTAGEAETLKKMEDEERSVIRPWELWKAQAQRGIAARLTIAAWSASRRMRCVRPMT